MGAAETLLGPMIVSEELTQDERDVISLYIEHMTEKVRHIGTEPYMRSS